jgi:hypothetical protein
MLTVLLRRTPEKVLDENCEIDIYSWKNNVK